MTTKSQEKQRQQKKQRDALARQLRGVQIGQSVEVRGEPEFLTFRLNREAVNEDERTIELSFSSDTDKVERWWGIEILDHGPKAVRLGAK